MRRVIFLVAAIAGFGGAMPASAATIVVFTDPMTMERHTVVVDPDGPDRVFLCTLPPGQAGCQAVKVERSR